MGRFHSLYPAPAPAGFLGVQVNLNLSRKCRTSMNHQEVWQTLDRFGLSVYRGVLCSMPLCLGPRPPESHPGHRHWLISSWTDPGAAVAMTSSVCSKGHLLHLKAWTHVAVKLRKCLDPHRMTYFDLFWLQSQMTVDDPPRHMVQDWYQFD